MDARRSFAVQLSLLLGIALALCGCSVSQSTEKAEAAVNEFHQRWNSGQFREMFDNAHMDFRRAQPFEVVANQMEALKRNYGAFQSAKKRSWGFSSNNGNTDVRLTYDSSFEQGNAVEEFVFRRTGDRALLLSYDIARPEVAAKREEERRAKREADRQAKEADRKAARDAKDAERKAKRDAKNP